jgi:hypothetical protein
MYVTKTPTGKKMSVYLEKNLFLRTIIMGIGVLCFIRSCYNNQELIREIHEADSMQTKILHIINSVKTKDFWAPTCIASGHNTVKKILQEKDGVKFLIENADASLPIIHALYRGDDTKIQDQVRIVYFLVFELTRDYEMVPDIVSYLRRCEGESEKTLLSPWHPFLYGMQALESITDGAVKAPISNEAVGKLEDFLNEIESWEK